MVFKKCCFFFFTSCRFRLIDLLNFSGVLFVDFSKHEKKGKYGFYFISEYVFNFFFSIFIDRFLFDASFFKLKFIKL